MYDMCLHRPITLKLTDLWNGSTKHCVSHLPNMCNNLKKIGISLSHQSCLLIGQCDTTQPNTSHSFSHMVVRPCCQSSFNCSPIQKMMKVLTICCFDDYICSLPICLVPCP